MARKKISGRQLRRGSPEENPSPGKSIVLKKRGGQRGWLPVDNAITASNTIFTATDILPASSQKFYKLEFEQP
jgi:hypothetical protein